ncbi:TonB-dependent receptor [Kiritimatiellota bacterium B12222]|nr:TonB-dependent receptor [Kiritimatiellota bacterium B12222]
MKNTFRITTVLSMGIASLTFLRAQEGTSIPHTPPESLVTAAAAQEASPSHIVDLDRVTVIPQQMSAVRTVSVIDESEIEKLQATTLGDVFRLDPEISVGGGATPSAQKIYIRGIEDTMINVQVDGARQPTSVYHHQSHIMLDPEFIKGIEVDSGAGSAVAGPGALGGSVRFVTKNASDFLEADQTMGALLKVGGYSNADSYKATGAGYGKINEHLNLLVLYSYFDADNYSDGNGDEVEYTGIEQDQLSVKADGTFGDGHSYTLGYDRYTDDGPRRLRNNFVGDIVHPVIINPVTDQESHRNSGTLNYAWQPEGSSVWDVEATLYINDYSSTQTSLEAATSGPPFFQNEFYDFELASRNTGVDLQNTTALEGAGFHMLTYGTNLRWDEGEFTNHSTGANPFSFSSWKDGKEDGSVSGVFIQDTWQVSSMLLLSFGTRWDYYDYTDRDDVNVNSNGFSPNAGVSVTPIEWLDVYANAAQAIRGMGVGEALWIGDARKTVDPDAKPETATNLEAGVTLTKGGWGANVEVFKNTIDDYVDYIDRTNQGDVEIPGYSASVGYQTGNFRGSVSMNYTDPEYEGESLINEVNIALGASTGRTWIGVLEYVFPEQQVVIGWNGRVVEELDGLPAGQPDKDGFMVHDFYCQWTPVNVEALTLTLTIANAFDEEYMEHTTYGYNSSLDRVAGLPEPGRDIRLAAAYKF